MDWRNFAGLLVREGLLTVEELAVIEGKMVTTRHCFWELVCEDEGKAAALADMLNERFGISSYFYNQKAKPWDTAVNLINAGFAFKHMLIPVKIEEDKLYVAFADPFNLKAHEELEIMLQYRIVTLYSPWQDINILLDTYYGKSRRNDMTSTFLSEGPENLREDYTEAEEDIQNAPSVKMVDSIIDMAILKNASDIHIEPYSEDVRVRFRIDGRLIEFERLSKRLHQPLVSRLKVMGGMDISEKRLPQDGRFIDTRGGLKIDLRLSTVPTIFGEKAVVRLLYEKTIYTDKNELGFSSKAIKALERLLMNTHGAVLLTGPTGSGKTTTMAAFLRELNTGDNNIITIEDPVENVIHGINQININPKTGFTFVHALRSILRQDPDIIMIGEIRDSDTARLAMRSALTGHLVFSTLHTNDSVSAIYRLIDMDVADYLVYSAVKGVISQRLVRRLCPECKKKDFISAQDAVLTGLPGDTEVFSSVGCQSCSYTGYSGRFAIYEILIMDEGLVRMFSEKRSLAEIKAHLKENGMKTLWDCGLENVLNGNTTIPEFCRAVFE